jgi:hypothetical protein
MVIPHRIIYDLRYPFGRFARLKHEHLARQVGVIVEITRQIQKTFIDKSIYSSNVEFQQLLVPLFLLILTCTPNLKRSLCEPIN